VPLHKVPAQFRAVYPVLHEHPLAVQVLLSGHQPPPGQGTTLKAALLPQPVFDTHHQSGAGQDTPLPHVSPSQFTGV
jgi:hypothetical protein